MPSAGQLPLKVLLCSPRGFCAGVVRAIDSVEQALRAYGAPVYVRHEIVHNRYVVESLKAKGAVFVEELDEVPDTDAPVIFSAHGVAKAVPEEAARRNLFALDATCPLVTKVHREAEIHHQRGREVVLIGHRGHPEVVGTMGQLPEGAVSAGREHRGCAGASPRATRTTSPMSTQTTLSMDDTAAIVDVLRRRFPEHRRAAQGGHLLRHHQPPGGGEAGGAAGRGDDRGRRAELLQLAAAERGRRARGLPARGAGAARRRYRLDDVRRRSASLGITAGASAPEVLVEEILDAFAERYALSVETVTAAEEDVFFPLPAPCAKRQPWDSA